MFGYVFYRTHLFPLMLHFSRVLTFESVRQHGNSLLWFAISFIVVSMLRWRHDNYSTVLIRLLTQVFSFLSTEGLSQLQFRSQIGVALWTTDQQKNKPGVSQWRWRIPKNQQYKILWAKLQRSHTDWIQSSMNTEAVTDWLWSSMDFVYLYYHIILLQAESTWCGISRLIFSWHHKLLEISSVEVIKWRLLGQKMWIISLRIAFPMLLPFSMRFEVRRYHIHQPGAGRSARLTRGWSSFLRKAEKCQN